MEYVDGHTTDDSEIIVLNRSYTRGTCINLKVLLSLEVSPPPHTPLFNLASLSPEILVAWEEAENPEAFIALKAIV